MMISFLIAILALFQPQTSDITYYNTRSGLSSNIIYDVYQDREGFIWVATDNGLNRFDGYDFVTFHHDPLDESSISNNIIRVITEDREGNIWVGTNDGLNMFDKKTNTFETYRLGYELEDVQDIYKDSKGHFWINLYYDLIRFDPLKRESVAMEIPIEAYSILIDSEDMIWIGGYEGDLMQYDISRNSLKEIPLKFKVAGRSISLGRNTNTIWASSIPEEINDSNWRQLPTLPSGRTVHRFLEDANETIWIGTETGLFQYYENSKKLVQYNFRDKSSPLVESIKSLFEDTNGGVWIGTLNGLFYVPASQKPFTHISGPNEQPKIVMGIASWNTGVLANIFSESLAEYDLENNKWDTFELPKEFTTLGRRIWAISSIKENPYSLWLGTDEGLYMMNPTNKRYKRIELPLRERITAGIFSIVRNDDDTIWISGHESIALLSSRTGEVKEIIKFPNELGLPTIQDIVITEIGILVATDGAGLFIYSKDEGFRSISEFIEGAEVLNRTSIWDMHESRNGTIYLGASNGLHQLILSKEQFKTISMENGFNNRVVFSIVEDSSGSLWLGSDYGLLRYDPKNENVNAYRLLDGVDNTEFNRRSILISGDRIWLGGIDGLTTFKPAEVKPSSVVPPIHITHFESTLSDTLISYPIHDTEIIQLPWNHGTIEIAFAALNYANPNQVQYRYILSGRNPDWVYSNNVRTARYVQLPSGEYDFRIEVSTDGVIWNNRSDSLKVIVHPPFWATVWFRGAIFLLIIVVLWLIYRYRVRQIVELERMKLRIAGDLHDEIGSGLSSIALTGDLLQNPDVDHKPELTRLISKNARELASSLDNIVWLIDPKKESVGELVARIKAITSDLAQSEVVYTEEVHSKIEDKPLPTVFRRNVFLLVKEALNNALKYAEAQQVLVQIHCTDRELRIKIKDDGKGFDIDKVSRGNGLSNMSARADDLGAFFKIESPEGKGTRVELKVKLP